jgi:hypothetical protein
MRYRIRLLLCSLLALLAVAPGAIAGDYCVVVSEQTNQDPAWHEVVQALVDKHAAEVLTFASSPIETLPQLQASHPRYTCFVATREEAGREFVATVHQLTRKLDADPYTDTFWGVLTGFDAANAQEIARYSTPLTVRKVASGTEVALEMCEQGLWYDELVKNKLVRKEKGGRRQELRGPDDTTSALVASLNEFQPDLFVTSGHATERDWQIGFRYQNGFFKSESGQLFGEDTRQQRINIDSPNPKVYLPIGNCLMGHIDGPDAMALAWMNDAGVKQMIGYTVPTWFGYGGWGVLDYFVEQPGRYSLTEAFFANHQALLHSLETGTGEQRGLAFDRDVVAFYGDPKWEAKMSKADCAYDQSLTQAGDLYTLRITPNRGRDSFRPINVNGAQRGYRPIVIWLPHRIKPAQVISGAEFQPLITDDFVLIPNPRECDPAVKYEVVFEAQQL